MKDIWRGSNVDIDKLTEGIQRFFTERQFEATRGKIENGYKIEAETGKILDVQLKILVNIYGQPNDFTVEFMTDAKRKGSLSPLMVLSYIATLIGGGAFLRGEIKQREAQDKLEKTFWEHVDRQVAELTDSASH
jgi:hypothetical protein